jgi:hypothetical protein
MYFCAKFWISSREIVEGARWMLAAIARIDRSWLIPARIFSRSAMFNVRVLTGSTSDNGGTPPALRNQRYPVRSSIPRHAEAPSTLRPSRIERQNRR